MYFSCLLHTGLPQRLVHEPASEIKFSHIMWLYETGILICQPAASVCDLFPSERWFSVVEMIPFACADVKL